jgi:hypothetical protein
MDIDSFVDKFSQELAELVPKIFNGVIGTGDPNVVIEDYDEQHGILMRNLVVGVAKKLKAHTLVHNRALKAKLLAEIKQDTPKPFKVLDKSEASKVPVKHKSAVKTEAKIETSEVRVKSELVKNDPNPEASKVLVKSEIVKNDPNPVASKSLVKPDQAKPKLPSKLKLKPRLKIKTK